MATSPHNPKAAAFAFESDPQESIKLRWAVLHEKAGEIAEMADLSPEPAEVAAVHFDEAIAGATEPTKTFAQQGLGDIEHLIDMGLRALKEVEARNQDASVPALALWREFYHAREAILGAISPGTLQPSNT